MTTLTIEIPDERHDRLQELAQYRQTSVDKLIEELSLQALLEFDNETRFRNFATQGNADEGLKLLGKLDNYFDAQN